MKYPVSIVLPSLNPDEKLMLVVKALTARGFDDIIIVNDGSDPENLKNFPDPALYPQCTILTHEVNRGKGAALKTAFTWFLENREGKAGVVTVDGDNQHRAEDVEACAKAMLEKPDTLILGVRDFSLPDVPKRSRMGNRITSGVFRVCCGLKISDTQTGLRAIPASCLPRFIKTQGERFEYETNMLLEMKTYQIPFEEVKIQTVYIEENKTSHFHPLRDSWRIYKLIFKFMFSSAAASIIDIVAFYLLSLLFGRFFGNYTIFACTVLARAISSISNFFLNKQVVFTCKEKTASTLLRYYALAIPQMLVSAGLVYLISHGLSLTFPFITTVFKAIVDTILFFISFQIQREWVFKRKDQK